MLSKSRTQVQPFEEQMNLNCFWFTTWDDLLYMPTIEMNHFHSVRQFLSWANSTLCAVGLPFVYSAPRLRSNKCNLHIRHIHHCSQDTYIPWWYYVVHIGNYLHDDTNLVKHILNSCTCTNPFHLSDLSPSPAFSCRRTDSLPIFRCSWLAGGTCASWVSQLVGKTAWFLAPPGSRRH